MEWMDSQSTPTLALTTLLFFVRVKVLILPFNPFYSKFSKTTTLSPS
jgi:hypothetical protein